MLNLSGCKNNQISVDETLPTESIKEEEDALDLESADKMESAAEETEQPKEEDEEMKFSFVHVGKISVVWQHIRKDCGSCRPVDPFIKLIGEYAE